MLNHNSTLPGQTHSPDLQRCQDCGAAVDNRARQCDSCRAAEDFLFCAGCGVYLISSNAGQGNRNFCSQECVDEYHHHHPDADRRLDVIVDHYPAVFEPRRATPTPGTLFERELADIARQPQPAAWRRAFRTASNRWRR